MAINGNHPTDSVKIEDEVTVVDLTVDDLEITMKGPSYWRDALLHIGYRQPEQCQSLVPVSHPPTGSAPAPMELLPLASLSLGPKTPVTDSTTAASEPPIDDSQHGLFGEDGEASHPSTHEEVSGAHTSAAVMSTGICKLHWRPFHVFL